MEAKMFQTIYQYSTQTFGITLNVFSQMIVVVAVVAVVVWAMLFTEYLPVHDAFHELRHSLYVIPCH
jgi:hypothetical protein